MRERTQLNPPSMAHTYSHNSLVSQTFYGLNRGLTVADGELNDCENLTSDYFPQLSPTLPRVPTGISLTGAYHGSITKNNDVYLAVGTQLIRVHKGADGYVQEPIPGLELEDNDKQMVNMGAQIVIWPDGIIVNTAGNVTENMTYSSMGAEWHVKDGNQAGFAMCTLAGEPLDGKSNYHVGATAPSKSNGMLWMNTKSTPAVLYQYSSADSKWEKVESTYVRIYTSKLLGNDFNVGDSVYITADGGEWHYTDDKNTPSAQGKQEMDRMLGFSSRVWGKGSFVETDGSEKHYIVVTGLIRDHANVTNLILRRRVPQFDYVCESQNRIWGCRYGKDPLEGTGFVNQLSASALGDPKNWELYEGISTDSYSVSMGSDGGWTGAISLNGVPCFFKEGILHRISGSIPTSFSTVTTSCRGVDAGDARSLQRVEQYLAYKCHEDILLYSGSTFSSIGKKLGQTTLARDTDFATVHGTRYYIGIHDDGIYVYDFEKGIWLKESIRDVVDAMSTDEELYFLMRTDTGYDLMRQSHEADGAKSEVRWSATFGAWGYDTKQHKYLTRFDLRMQMAQGSSMIVELQYDHDGVWHKVGELRSKTVRSFMLPVMPRRCDHVQLRLTGRGKCKMISLARILELGSDN